MSHRRRKLIIFLALFVGIPTLSFFTSRYGYCQSWWGKDNLLFRSWWLCHCPGEFEQTLYPEYISVMYPTCQGVSVEPTNNANFLLAFEGSNILAREMHLRNLVTDESTPFQPPYDSLDYWFLTNEWILLSPQGGVPNPFQVWHPTNNQAISLEWLGESSTPHPYLVDNSPNPAFLEIIGLFQSRN